MRRAILSLMRFLFAVRVSFLRVFESTIRELCNGGDEVVAVLDRSDDRSTVATRLENEFSGLTIRTGADPRSNPEHELEGSVRMWIDYLRYFEPELAFAKAYRERRGQHLAPDIQRQTDRAAESSPDVLRALAVGLRAIERSLPVPEDVIALLDQTRPDAVLVSPLLRRTSPQVRYLRAARSLGIPSALCVASWDNLSTTGVIHEIPDLVTVWNEYQRWEAEEMHGVPPERVAVTGAPRFDDWFDQSPTTSREAYCTELGLPVDRPHVLYVGSSKFTAPDEASWIVRWIRAIRASGHVELSEVPVVVRAHPTASLRGDGKGARRLSRMPGVVLHPPTGAAVVDSTTLGEYYDSIYHAGAVVGINTSAMIEAAVVGRAVHVLLANRYRQTQVEAPHFRHLLTAGGGLIDFAEDLEQHARNLVRTLRGENADEVMRRSKAFLASFIRPHGLDRRATPVLTEALRDLARRRVEASGPRHADLYETLKSLAISPPGRKRVRRALGGDSGKRQVNAADAVYPDGDPTQDRTREQGATGSGPS